MIKFLFLLLPFTRVGSGDSFDVGTWESGDNPGAGSQDFTVFTDTGLNGNFKRIWRAIKNLLNSDGTIQNDKLTGANLIPATTADGSTIEFNNATGAKTLRIKDLGVTTAKINDLAVTTAKIATDAVDNTILKDDASVDANRAVTTNHIRDGNVTSAKIADFAVTCAKQATSQVGYQIYGDTRVSGFSAGNTVAAIMEWAETSASDVVKIAVKWHPQPGDRYVKLACRIKTSNAAGAVTATISDGSTSASVATTATAYSGASGGWVVAILDGGAVLGDKENYATGGFTLDITVALKCAGGFTGNMKDVVLYVLKGVQT